MMEIGELSREFEGRHQECLKIVSKSGMCPIILALKEQPMKFTDLVFEARLNSGVLAKNLKILTNSGVVAKDEKNNYTITEVGRKFMSVVEELIETLDLAAFNCWEYQQCGRGPEGHKVDELGICPAATEENLDGVHGGKNAGRACWAVAGTYGDRNCTKLSEYGTCEDCDFYKYVKSMEPEFMSSGSIREMIDKV